jgi:hypothetical protein
MKSSPPRRLILDDKCIVVLDTSPIRNIAEERTVPPWVATFAEMAKDGYSFSLGDTSFAEILSQRQNGRIKGDYGLMISTLHRFLNPEIPVLPGKIDILQMIGTGPKSADWSEAEMLAQGPNVWKILEDAKPTSPESIHFLVRIWRCILRMLGLARREETIPEMFQAERDEWIEMFRLFKTIWERNGKAKLDEYRHADLEHALKTMDHGERINPSMSVRCDFQVRFLWRQFVRSQKATGAYDPASTKKKNDNLDFDFLRYLSLPALFLAEKKAFSKNAIKDIQSFQTGWVLTPQELADAWTKGERPWPKWPV